jgi:carbon-monoxide dehydrogenase medium subunit
VKLPPFEYSLPKSLDEAAGILASAEGGARPLAGGQSLLPIMALRLAAPERLVDLRNVPDLRSIAVSDQGVRLGAMTRWRDIARHEGLATALPILPAAIDHVAHYAIQNRGTIGGSLAHADPAAEFPGIAVTCDAVVEIFSSSGRREIPAAELFVGPLETSLDPADIIVGVRFPKWPQGRRWAYEEFARRRGDFALAAVALFYDLENGVVANAHVGVIGATDRPRRLAEAEAALNGGKLDDAAIAAAASAASKAVNPSKDMQASIPYRRALVGTLVSRALQKTLK